MSQQHFYSRVPARVSLYNKIDSFDTFAQSAGLERSFVLGELSRVYADKLRIHDPLRVRRGEIPTVYTQAMLPSGEVVQTAVTYQPYDFTGERSAYLAHSLVLSEGERSLLYANNRAVPFNHKMFLTDISGFGITAPTAAPNSNIPEREYIPRALFDIRLFTSRFDPEMLKDLIYSIISSICDDGRTVYFRLPCDDRDASIYALEFINAIMCVLPYELRQRLSFVSFVSDPDSYSGFKLKCVSSSVSEVSPYVGVFFDFARGNVSGLSPNAEKNRSLSNFFYSLLDNSKVRDDFHIFLWKVFDKYPDLDWNLKTISEIIYLFWQCSGYYIEQSILPDDGSVDKFFSIYTKYRDAIDEPYRVNAYRCLRRYSLAQISLPQGIFDKLRALYPDEPPAVKAVALDVLLKLIHLDVMRREIFGFINTNYDGEVPAVKDVINHNLVRVFYGGFLQVDILNFFDRHFDDEPLHIKAIIFDRLILSIRTPMVHRRIVSFLERHYDKLTSEQRLKLYKVSLEMIPECDALSTYLIGLINRNIAKEGLHIHNLTEKAMVMEQDRRLRSGDGRLTALLIENTGYLEEISFKFIFSSGVGVNEFIDILTDMPANRRAAKLLSVYKAVPDMPIENYEWILSVLGTRPTKIETTMYQLIEADRIATNLLPEHTAQMFREIVVYPAIVHTLYDVFNLRYGKGGIDKLVQYAKDKDILTECEQYATVMNYLRMVELCDKGDISGAFRIAYEFPDSATLRNNICEHIRMCSLNTNVQSGVTTFTYEIILNYLKTGNFRFDYLYSKYKKIAYELDYAGESPENPESFLRESAANTMELILTTIEKICAVAGNLTGVICDESSGLRDAIVSFTETYGFGSSLFIKQKGAGCPYDIVEMVDEITRERYAGVTTFKEAFDIFIRKK